MKGQVRENCTFKNKSMIFILEKVCLVSKRDLIFFKLSSSLPISKYFEWNYSIIVHKISFFFNCSEDMQFFFSQLFEIFLK